MKAIEEDEIFYDASDNLSPQKKPKIKNNFNFDSNVENIPETQILRTAERRETLYEDANDNQDPQQIYYNDFGNERLSNISQRSSTQTFQSELNEKKEREKEKNRKFELMSEELKEMTIDLEFMKKNFKLILPKSKGLKEKHLSNVFELQNFQGDSQQIWALKISTDGKYLATGGKSGVVKIWEIFTEEESLENYEYKGLISYFKFINETAYRIYTEHSQDIIDICWNLKSEENVFVSGSFDKIVRIWNPIKNKVIDYINVQEYITSVAFFPAGDQIAVGSHTGKCSIYECNPKLKYSYSFDCKNKTGKYSDGRKITNIDFLNKNHVLVTTNDSSIRLINVNDGKMIQKYKGLVNDEYMIRASFEEIYDLIISASDDGYVYVWHGINPEPNSLKNKTYEYLKPFEKENSTCSIFANDIALSTYIKKMMKVTSSFFIKSVIINTSNSGRIQILINSEK